MDVESTYACLFQVDANYYLVDEKNVRVDLCMNNILSILCTFEKYKYILTINGYTTFMRKLYYLSPENQKYVTNHKLYYYFTLYNNMIDLSLYATGFNKVGWFTHFMDTYQPGILYGGDLIVELDLLNKLARQNIHYAKGDFYHHMLIYPYDFIKNVLVKKMFVNKYEKSTPIPTIILKKQPILNSRIVVWYTYPIKYRSLENASVYDSCMSDAMPPAIEVMYKRALETIPNSQAYVDELVSKSLDIENLVSIDDDYIISVETEGGYRDKMSALFGHPMYVKNTYVHFWQLSKGVWVGVDPFDMVEMCGFTTPENNSMMKKYLYENILHKPYPILQLPKYHISFNPYFLTKQDWRVSKVGYVQCPYNAADFLNYNQFYDTNFFLKKEYQNPMAYWEKLNRGFVEVCRKYQLIFHVLQKFKKHEYYIQCKHCHDIKYLIDKLNPNHPTCQHTVVENFIEANGHYNFGFYTMATDIMQCDLCSLLYAHKSGTCRRDVYQVFDRWLPDDHHTGLVVCPTRIQQYNRASLAKYSPPHQLVSTLVLTQGELVPIVLVDYSMVDLATLLMLEGYLPDAPLNLGKLQNGTVLHCLDYGFVYIVNNMWIMSKNPIDIVKLITKK